MKHFPAEDRRAPDRATAGVPGQGRGVLDGTPTIVQSVGQRSQDAARVAASEVIANRLDRPMGFLGIAFVFVVLGQLLVEDPAWNQALVVTGWVFWALFVAEFLLRAYVARFQAAFWRRNWWQVIFLLVPFLRFVRALQALRLVRLARLTRVGGIVSAGVRGSRSARRLLSSRIAWLGAVTAVVVLASSQLLYILGSHDDYGVALFEAALATITGSGISTRDPFSRVLQVALAIYSVGVFATLAGSIGAFFLEGRAGPRQAGETASASGPSHGQHHGPGQSSIDQAR